MSTAHPSAQDTPLPPSVRIAVVAARFNAHITDALLADSVTRLKQLGLTEARITLARVPGAFELPLAAKWYADTQKYAAVICLGCIIRGDTPHFDFVAHNAASGIARVSLDSAVPVIFGVLTTNTEEQATARTFGPHSRSGINAADAAAEMIRLRSAVC
jgi:6,7-dimethyl-8-ribityllumazine synthase